MLSGFATIKESIQTFPTSSIYMEISTHLHKATFYLSNIYSRVKAGANIHHYVSP